MLELGIGADLVRGIGLVLWGLLAVALLVALFKPKTITGKALSSLLVLGIFFGPMVPGAMRANEHKKRYTKAQALFDERCKTAGEKIYRTVEGVEGVLLENTRGKFDISNFKDQNWDGAGFSGESSGNRYIMEFVFYNIPSIGLAARSLDAKPGGVRGYKTVDAELAGQIKQFSLRDVEKYTAAGFSGPVEKFGSVREIPVSKARYAVVYENIADPEGRVHWVAGGTVKVVDRTTNEILGEFTRYSFDTGLGETGGGRDPWSWAATYGPRCPLTTYGNSSGHIRSFVEQVLKPKQGN